jgi:hypothetical protein
VAQLDNLGRQPFVLPELVVRGAREPVVQVRDATGEVVCTVRIPGDRAILPVPAGGPHEVAVWHGGGWVRRSGIGPVRQGERPPPVVLDLR